MLDSTRLLGNLREFCDSSYASFRAFPTTREQARSEWAQAFADYFDQVQEAIVPPLPGHPMLNLAAVQGAFFADLGLEPGISAPASAADFAGAWRQGVLAVTPGGTITDSALNAYVFVSFANVPPLHDALLATLTALFQAPSASALARLTEIAQAFHVASAGLMAAVTITVSGVPSPGVIGVL